MSNNISKPIRTYCLVAACCEGFSYDDLFFFATGFEISNGLPLTRQVHLTTSLLSLLKLTWDRKSYGTTQEDGGPYYYTEEYYRWNFKRELWMTGSAGVRYQREKWDAGIVLQFPLAYLLYISTDLYDTEGTSHFSQKKSNMFQVQQPFKLFVNVGFKL